MAGVRSIVVPGWDGESSQHAIELAEKYPQLYAAVGIHPTAWQKQTKAEVDLIRTLSSHEKVVAIGEIGLDYYHEPLDKEAQHNLLKTMLNIATECQKPLILHSRESMTDILVLLKEWLKTTMPNRIPLGVFHAFEGNLSQAFESIEMGFLLGVGGPITYKNAALKREVFSQVPLNSILFETDAPYLSPEPHRGERNEPAFLSWVGSALAEMRGIAELELTEQIMRNSNKMFLQDRVN